ncbi:MAG: cell wall-binding repeat-containing protein [Bacillota bacterium]
MRFLKKILVLTLIVLLALPGVTGADADPVTRISGSDRYATAVEVSKSGWSSASVVVLARGDDYADALAGVPLAYRLGAPILLVEPNRLPSVTRQELVRLGAIPGHYPGRDGGGEYWRRQFFEEHGPGSGADSRKRPL